MSDRKKIIAVDFDGTLCADAYPNIGKPDIAVIESVKRLQNKGYILILWTCRDGDELAAAVEWCVERGLVFDYINENAKENIEEFKNDSRKIYADIYIDDKAMPLWSIFFSSRGLENE